MSLSTVTCERYVVTAADCRLSITVAGPYEERTAHNASALLDFPDSTGSPFLLPRAPTAPPRYREARLFRAAWRSWQQESALRAQYRPASQAGLAGWQQRLTIRASSFSPSRTVEQTAGSRDATKAVREKGASPHTPHPIKAATTTTKSNIDLPTSDDGDVGISEWRGSDTVAAQRRKRDRSTSRAGWPAFVRIYSTYVPPPRSQWRRTRLRGAGIA